MILRMNSSGTRDLVSFLLGNSVLDIGHIRSAGSCQILSPLLFPPSDMSASVVASS